MAPMNKLDDFNILIADDEQLIRKLVLGVLTNLGFTKVTAAPSGRKAIEYISKNKFDFIITDWRMLDMDGIDIVRYVRSLPDPARKTIPIIMLTGNTEVHFVKTAISAGVNGYLLKPFSAEQLVKRIRTVIEAPREFIISKKYTGPDRRHGTTAPPDGVERRKPRKKK